MTVAALFLLGLSLSAFFSGSETGFYRVTRVRLVFNARSGDWISRLLLWLTNNPALFVATTLVGNNVANYLTSLAIVMGVSQFWGSGYIVELTATLCFSPIVFVYGELLPKNLFLQAPNMLLRRGGALFAVFLVLFSPLAAILWGLGKLLESLVGATPLRIKLSLARRELQDVLREGQDAGVLRPAQQRLAQDLFSVASQPVEQFCMPSSEIVEARMGDPTHVLLQQAARRGAVVAPVYDPVAGDWAGYVRIVDLYLDGRDTISRVRPLPEIRKGESHLDALLRMQSEKEELARVIDENGETVGLLYAETLTAPLLRTG